MKPTILFAVMTVCTFAGLEQGFGAILAEWHQFNTFTATFPVSATSSAPGISSAVMNTPVNLTKINDNSGFWLSDWNPATTVDTGEYFEVSLSIASGFAVSLSELTINGRHSSDNFRLHLRSSSDGFTTDIGAFNLTGEHLNDNYTFDLSSLPDPLGTVAFRFYSTEALPSSPAVRFEGENTPFVPGGGFLEVSGTATAVPEPSFYEGLSGSALLAFALCRRFRRR